eukprot:gene23575-49561_t
MGGTPTNKQFFDTVKQHRPGSAPVTYAKGVLALPGAKLLRAELKRKDATLVGANLRGYLRGARSATSAQLTKLHSALLSKLTCGVAAQRCAVAGHRVAGLRADAPDWAHGARGPGGYTQYAQHAG